MTCKPLLKHGISNLCLPYCGFCRGTSLSTNHSTRTRREVWNPRWPTKRPAQQRTAGGFYCLRQIILMTFGSYTFALCHMCSRCKILMWSCTEIWLCARWLKELWTPIKLSFFSISGYVAITLSEGMLYYIHGRSCMGQEVMLLWPSLLSFRTLLKLSESWEKNVFITSCFHIGPLLYLTGLISSYFLDYIGEIH